MMGIIRLWPYLAGKSVMAWVCCSSEQHRCQDAGPHRPEKKLNRPMTQELVLGVLLAGLVGLTWAVTVSLLWADHQAREGLTPT